LKTKKSVNRQIGSDKAANKAEKNKISGASKEALIQV
jgi:hypothetical protein